MPLMRAKKDFQFRTRDVRAGEQLQVSPAEAAALKYQGKADFENIREQQLIENASAQLPAIPSEPDEPSPDPAPEKPKRLRKRRADVDAENLNHG